ncbi:MAG: sodium:solute symporter family protein [Rickettsiales bacterium]|nr:sodium:solute symporter family protein [Rickettsiales bacterium]
MNLNRLDLSVFVILTVLTLLYTVLLSRRHNEKSAVDYLLFGRKLTLPLFVTTLVSTWYGDIFGVTQIAFKRGINTIAIYGIGFYISGIFFMIFFVEKARKMNVFTLPEIIQKKYGKTAYKLSSLMILIKALPVTYLIGIGLLIQRLFGLDLYYSMIVGLIFVISYIGVRGFSGIIYSDAIQFVLMYVSVIMVVVFSYFQYGGYDFLDVNLDESYFSINANEAFSGLFLWFFISIITTFMSPVFYQRCFAAKDVKIAKRGIVISVIFWMICDLCTVTGSMYAKAVLPNSMPNEAYFNYALNILPIGLKGVFLAGIAATILSTLDSFLFICSNTLVYDLFDKRFSKSNVYKMGSLIVVGGITFFLAGHFANDIDKFYLLLRSYCGVTLAIPLMCTIIFGKFLSEKQFVASIILAGLFMIINDLIKTEFYVESFYIGALASFFSIAIFVIINNTKKKFLLKARC